MRKAPAIRERIQRIEADLAELRPVCLNAFVLLYTYMPADRAIPEYVLLDLSASKAAAKFADLEFQLKEAEKALQTAIEEDNAAHPLPDQFRAQEELVETMMDDYLKYNRAINLMLDATVEGKTLVYSRDYAYAKMHEAATEAKRLAKEIAERDPEISGTIGKTGAFQVAVTQKVRPAGSTFDLTNWLDRVADLPSASAKTIAAIEKGITFSSSLVDILQNEEYTLACGTPLVNIEQERVPKFMEAKLAKQIGEA